MEFSEVVRRRRMVGRFTDEPVLRGVVERIVEAAHHAPSVGFSQGVSFVVVTDAARPTGSCRHCAAAGVRSMTSSTGSTGSKSPE